MYYLFPLFNHQVFKYEVYFASPLKLLLETLIFVASFKFVGVEINRSKLEVWAYE